MRQLELFSVDQIRVREGYQALEALDINGALAIFRALEHYDDVAESAIEAIEACLEWRKFDSEHGHLRPVARAEHMWSVLATDGRFVGKARLSLRKGLASRLITELAGTPLEIPESGFCRGWLLTEAGRLWEAEAWYREALETAPNDVRLHRQLGDLLWQNNKRSDARQHYCRALLIAPNDVPLADLPDPQLTEVIEQHGPEMAPVFAAAYRMMTTPEAEGPPTSRQAAILRIIDAAERARRVGHHDEMVVHREKLMHEAPEVFNAYMRNV